MDFIKIKITELDKMLIVYSFKKDMKGRTFGYTATILAYFRGEPNKGIA